jgi:hypothetical protein
MKPPRHKKGSLGRNDAQLLSLFHYSRQAKYSNAMRAAEAGSLLAAKENAFRLSRARSRRNPSAQRTDYHERIHRDQSNLIPPRSEAFIQQALELLGSDRYLQKCIGPHGPDRRQPAEIFL